MEAKIKVLHLSTHNEDCGIAKFQEGIVDGLGHQRYVENVFFPISPNKLKQMQGEEFVAALNQLAKQLKDFTILHIQHEYSFFGAGQLQQIVDLAKSLGKKVLFTLHTPPHAHRETTVRPSLVQMIRPRTALHTVRAKRSDERFMTDYITPLLGADMLIATSRESIASFGAYGVPAALMEVVELPVPEVDTSKKSTDITTRLNKQSGDVILSTVGFISETKGIIPAIKSLTFLPKNYKLAIIGGSHPSGQNDAFYDHVCDVIVDLHLQDRVYITGYVASDAERDALVRETDICLYPYNRAYYDYVSSAALTNAISNTVPIVAYKTKTFLEANSVVSFMNFAQSANYYELARSVQAIDSKKSKKLTEKYADIFSVKNQAKKFAAAYRRLLEK